MLKHLFIWSVLLSHFGFGQQQNVLLLDVWNDTTITLGVEDARFSDIWGFVLEGEHYCAIGSTEGVELLHVGEKKLTKIDRMPGAFQGYTVVHRDMKVYQHYLYAVGDEGTATLQIFDLSYLPDSVTKVYDSNALFATCHNLFIDTTAAKLYACGANSTGMKVLDISDPANPSLLLDFNNVAYVHDCYVRNNIAYLNCGFDGLQIYDFSGPVPIQLGELSFYSDQGYNHSGWLSKDGTKYVFIDETKGTKIKLCEIGDLSLIQVDELFGTADYESYTPHNVIVLNKTAFVAYYNEGLRIFDISSTPIKQIGVYDTFWQETAYTLNGAWGVFVFEESNQVLITDRQNGVFLFKFPIDVLESDATGLVQTNVPFIDENSVIIPRDYFSKGDIKFTIADLRGAIVYEQENYLSWMSIPLALSPGAYYFGIYDSDRNLLETGKFVKAN